MKQQVADNALESMYSAVKNHDNRLFRKLVASDNLSMIWNGDIDTSISLWLYQVSTLYHLVPEVGLLTYHSNHYPPDVILMLKTSTAIKPDNMSNVAILNAGWQ